MDTSMNAKTRNNRRGSLTPWIAAGVAVIALVLGLAAPVTAALAVASPSSDVLSERAVAYPSPVSKPNGGPVVAQPGDPCPIYLSRSGCDPQPQNPTPTYTP